MSSDENAGRLDSASTGRLLVILIVLVVFSEIVPFQYAMVGLILPKIGLAFPAAGANSTWALTIVGVVGAATLPLCGKASDLWGKKRMLLILAVFLFIGTLICAVTSNWALFLVGRGLMATSFCMSAVAYGVVRDLMPRRWIPVVMGVIATGFGASAIARAADRRLADRPLQLAVDLLVPARSTSPSPARCWPLVVPESPYRVRAKLDVVGRRPPRGRPRRGARLRQRGQQLGLGHHQQPGLPDRRPRLLAAFLLWESRISEPLMELSMLRAPRSSIVMAIALFATRLLALPRLVIPYMLETPTASSLRNQIIAQAAAKEHVSVARHQAVHQHSRATSTTRRGSRCSSSPGTSPSSFRSPRCSSARSAATSPAASAPGCR